jgi:hypothetical protein
VLSLQVTFFICEEDDLDNHEDDAKQATELKIPIVKKDFIYECIKQAKKVPHAKFTLEYKKKEEPKPAPSKRKAPDSDSKELKKSKSDVSAAPAPTITQKGVSYTGKNNLKNKKNN